MDIEAATVVIDGQRWEKDLPELDDLEVLVAPWQNKAFERELQKLIGKLPPALRPDGKVESGAYYICVGRTIARTILFDWKNFKVGGTERPFDRAYAEQLLVDQRYRPFRDGVVAAAQRVQQNVKAAEEEIVGKSASSSDGSASGEAT